MMHVPFVDLRASHRLLRDELAAAFHAVLDRADFVLGDDVSRLEEEFARYCGARRAVGVASGLQALELTLRAAGVGPGDEVIVPAHTFVATAAAVTFCQAVPVTVDVNPDDYTIDVAAIAAAVTPRTRAIIPVHLYGLPANMDAIMALADEYGLFVLEDACQAHGAWYRGRRTGTLGHAAAFSFYPSKNLGACGDGGIVVTDDDALADTICALRNCGQLEKGRHELAPLNSRLDTLQAALLRVKLRHLDAWNAARRRAAALYTELLSGSRVTLPVERSDSTHVYHLYVIRTPQRDALRQALQERGIGTGIHYPLPVHRQPFYLRNGLRATAAPHAEQLCDEILSLPMFPEITDEQVAYVASCIRAFEAVPQTG